LVAGSLSDSIQPDSVHREVLVDKSDSWSVSVSGNFSSADSSDSPNQTTSHNVFDTAGTVSGHASSYRAIHDGLNPVRVTRDWEDGFSVLIPRTNEQGMAEWNENTKWLGEQTAGALSHSDWSSDNTAGQNIDSYGLGDSDLQNWSEEDPFDLGVDLSQIPDELTNELPSSTELLLRSFMGDKSDEVLAWKEQNRENHPYWAAFFDGSREVYDAVDETIFEPLRDVKEPIYDAFETGREAVCMQAPTAIGCSHIGTFVLHQVLDKYLPGSANELAFELAKTGAEELGKKIWNSRKAGREMSRSEYLNSKYGHLSREERVSRINELSRQNHERFSNQGLGNTETSGYSASFFSPAEKFPEWSPSTDTSSLPKSIWKSEPTSWGKTPTSSPNPGPTNLDPFKAEPVSIYNMDLPTFK